MRVLLILILSLGLGACGVETASTAATAAQLKKTEIEAGQQQMNDFKQRLEQADQAAQERAAAMRKAAE